jgi:hypothetical protein
MLNKFIFSQEEEDLTHTINLYVFAPVMDDEWLTFWLLVKGEMYGHVYVSFCFVKTKKTISFWFCTHKCYPVSMVKWPMLKVGPLFLRVKQKDFIHYSKVVPQFLGLLSMALLIMPEVLSQFANWLCKALHKCLRQVHDCKLTTKDPLVSMIVKLWDCLLGHMGRILHVKNMWNFDYKNVNPSWANGNACLLTFHRILDLNQMHVA